MARLEADGAIETFEVVFTDIWLAFGSAEGTSWSICGGGRLGSSVELAGPGALGLGLDLLRCVMKRRGLNLSVKLKGLCFLDKQRTQHRKVGG